MTSTFPVFRFRLGATFAVLVLALVGTVEEARAQRGCGYVAPTASWRQRTLPGNGAIWYLGSPHLACEDGVRIQADTAVIYTAQNLSHLMGNVVFIDDVRELEADEARYFSQQGRLQAHGNLVVRDTEQGSVVEHGDLVYLRRTDFREEEQMTFRIWTDGIRPTALLYMRPDSTAAAEEPEEGVTVPTPALRDSSSLSLVPTDTAVAGPTEAARDSLAAEPAEDTVAAEPVATPPEPDPVPYRVTGNMIYLQGSSYFRSTGDVVIERDSINAYGQSAEYDQVAGRILLEEEARVVTSGYDLAGRVIHIAMVDGAMREVRAIRDGVLTGDDLVLTAPMIMLTLDDGAMERLVAVPLQPDPDSLAAGVPVDSTMLSRPVAVAEQFTLIADSLDVRSPGEVLERIFAVGNARGESRARDSLNVEVLPEVARTDWLEGDTVIASFVKVLVVDTTSATGSRTAYRLNQLEAKGAARSLYRLDPADTTRAAGVDPPAVHYVLGQEILIALLDGEVDHMDVHGQTRGYHWEPLRPVRDSLALDSLALDSLAVDSSGVADTIRPDTSVALPPPPVRPAALSEPRSDTHRGIRPDPFNRSRRPW